MYRNILTIKKILFILSIILILLSSKCKEVVIMEFSRNTKLKAESFFIAKIVSINEKKISPSIAVKSSILTVESSNINNGEKFKIVYDRYAIVKKFEKGRRYLFAVNDTTCIAYFEVLEDNTIVLPSGKTYTAEQFIAEKTNTILSDIYDNESIKIDFPNAK